jgi:hypothetical protein
MALWQLLVFSLMARENSFLSITVPKSDGEAFNEASFTSPALSPKIARKAFLQEKDLIHL